MTLFRAETAAEALHFSCSLELRPSCASPQAQLCGPHRPRTLYVLDDLDTPIPAEEAAFAERLQAVGRTKLDSQNLLRQLLQNPSLLKKIQELRLQPESSPGGLSSLGDKDFRQALRLSLERKGTLSVEQLEKLKEAGSSPSPGGDLSAIKPDDAFPASVSQPACSSPSPLCSTPNPLPSLPGLSTRPAPLAHSSSRAPNNPRSSTSSSAGS